MSCLFPVVIKTPQGKCYKVPCRHCLNCRVSYQSQLEFMTEHELFYNYRSGHGASFVCFTYDDNHLPLNNSLCKKDLQLFLKRMRRYCSYRHYNTQFKFLACGEYGDSFGRPHYHVIFIGLTDVQINSIAPKCWSYGLIDVGVLGQGGLRYVLKYCSKSVGGKLAQSMYEDNGLERPFLSHSINLGKQFVLDNFEDISAHNFCYLSKGERVPLPKYLRNRFDKHKTFDKTAFLQKLSDEAKTFGFDDYEKYANYKAYNNEVKLKDMLRQKGYAFDDTELRMTYPVSRKVVRIDELASLSLV